MIHRLVSGTTAFLLFLNSLAPFAFALPHLDTDQLRAISTKGTDAEARLEGDPSWVHPASVPAAQHRFLEDRANELMSSRFEARRAMALWDEGVQRPENLNQVNTNMVWQRFLRSDVETLVRSLSDQEVASRLQETQGKGYVVDSNRPPRRVLAELLEARLIRAAIFLDSAITAQQQVVPADGLPKPRQEVRYVIDIDDDRSLPDLAGHTTDLATLEREGLVVAFAGQRFAGRTQYYSLNALESFLDDPSDLNPLGPQVEALRTQTPVPDAVRALALIHWTLTRSLDRKQYIPLSPDDDAFVTAQLTKAFERFRTAVADSGRPPARGVAGAAQGPTNIAAIDVEPIAATPEGTTLRARMRLVGGTVGPWFGLPAGTSKGEFEAHTVGQEEAMANIGLIHAMVQARGMADGDLLQIHELILEQNENIAQRLGRSPARYGGLGADAVLPFEAAMLYAKAAAEGVEPRDKLQTTFPEAAGEGDTLPLMVVWSGGQHAPGTTFGEDKFSIQELLIAPARDRTVEQAKEMYQTIRQAVDEALREAGFGPEESKEGGIAQKGIGSIALAIQFVIKAAEEHGYVAGRDFHVRLDAAANSFFDEERRRYNFDGEFLTTAQLIQAYQELDQQFSGVIESIEDPFAEFDLDGWRAIKTALPHWARVADDLTASQLDLVERYADLYDILLVKPNQAGSLVDTMRVIALAKQLDKQVIVSHRSKEAGTTYDDADLLIAHIASAAGAPWLKTAPTQPVRTAKIDKLSQLASRGEQAAEFQRTRERVRAAIASNSRIRDALAHYATGPTTGGEQVRRELLSNTLQALDVLAEEVELYRRFALDVATGGILPPSPQPPAGSPPGPDAESLARWEDEGGNPSGSPPARGSVPGVLEAFHHGLASRLTKQQVADALGLSPSTIEPDLYELTELGVLIKEGTSDETTYRLAHALRESDLFIRTLVNKVLLKFYPRPRMTAAQRTAVREQARAEIAQLLPTRVAINGAGRIGVNLIRAWLQQNPRKIDIVAINDIAFNFERFGGQGLEDYVTLLQREFAAAPRTQVGNVTFRHEQDADGQYWLSVNDKRINVYDGRDPAALPWSANDVDVALESTGVFTNREAASKHLAAGAKKVIITAPATGELQTIAPGVNQELLNADQIVLSCASCTTNAIAPPLKLLSDAFGIKSFYMETTHAYTADQSLKDTLRPGAFLRGREAAENIIPTSTGAAKAIGDVIPELAGKGTGVALRVPVADGSIVGITAVVEKPTTKAEVNELLRKAAVGPLKGIMAYGEEELVSRDILGRSESSIIAGNMTDVSADGKLVTVWAWYDNEFGYSNRVMDLVALVRETALPPAVKAAVSETPLASVPAPVQQALEAQQPRVARAIQRKRDGPAIEQDAGTGLVYFFGGGRSEGFEQITDPEERLDVFGGKGFSLHMMSSLGLPVPPGFTISAKVGSAYVRTGELPPQLMEDVAGNMQRLTETTGKGFGDPQNPLLVSVRSGARVSMPGMMDTVLNLGLNDQTVQGLAQATGDPRFAQDSWRRFIESYGSVVLGVPTDEFRAILEPIKQKVGAAADSDLSAATLQDEVIPRYKALVKEKTGHEFPQDVQVQLEEAIKAVFESWNSPRAKFTRQRQGISEDMGTAANVVSMVFGNRGPNSGTGVYFTRDASTGNQIADGSFAANAQGEDVVSGRFQAQPLTRFRDTMPTLYRELLRVGRVLEDAYRDMADIEFTVEDGKLYILQSRVGKRTGRAAVKIAVDLVGKGVITQEEALQRVKPDDLIQALSDTIDSKADVKGKELRDNDGKLVKGAAVSAGAAAGQVVFTPEDAVAWRAQGKQVVLAREQTTPDDVEGMVASAAILTEKGGSGSHATLVARSEGIPAVVGVGAMHIDQAKKQLVIGGRAFREGDWITIDANENRVFGEQVKTISGQMTPLLKQLLGWADGIRTLGVRANADTPEQARKARAFGAEGIGLARTEHMFLEEDRLPLIREMIFARDDPEARRRALERLLPLQQNDFEGILRAMAGLPVTIRLLDPPMHEFLPHTTEEQRQVSKQLGIPLRQVQDTVEKLREANPMLGTRGVRLGVMYPEITEMQVRAIFQAAVRLVRQGVTAMPEVMIPLIMDSPEFKDQEAIIKRVAEEVLSAAGLSDADVPYLIGTMIELPSASLRADNIAEAGAEFFSFGTNDLTQTAQGLSRDDTQEIIAHYIQEGLLQDDPFTTLHPSVQELMLTAIAKGRSVSPKLKIGICGEHGRDPRSIVFSHQAGLNYVSPSHIGVAVARLVAAQAELDYPRRTRLSPTQSRELARAEQQPRRPIIGGNWKAAVESQREARELLKGIAAQLDGMENTDIVVFASDLHLPTLRNTLQRLEASGEAPKERILLGAQIFSLVESGAKTGQTSVDQLKDLGISYVLLGHSEVRRGDLTKPEAERIIVSSEVINAQAKLALAHDFKMILAAGESREEREAGQTQAIVEDQIRKSLAGISKEQMADVVIAYEPVWAIGTGLTATPEQADEVQRDIRGLLLGLFDEDVAARTRIQYGGSMKPDNIAQLIEQPNIDGGLIGGASLKADDLVAIIRGANEFAQASLGSAPDVEGDIADAVHSAAVDDSEDFD